MNTLQKLWSWACSSNSRDRALPSRIVLGVEQLDARIVPAGNVTGVVKNGNLFLTGDGESNSIEVRKGLSNIRIVSLDGTAINGAVGIEDFSGVFKDVIINLKGGADLVNLEGGGGGTAAVIPRDLIFNGGGGADTLTSVPGAVIGRDLIFRGAAGVTNATLDGIDIGRHARFIGNNNVLVESLNFTKVNGVLSVKASALADVGLDDTTLGALSLVADGQADLDLTNVFVGGNASFKGGTGADVIDMSLGTEILGNLVIKTRGGNDTVEPNADVGGNVFIHLGNGANQVVDTFNMTVYGSLTILSTGNGIDDWTLDGVDVLGQTTLLTNGGADTVLFNDSEFFGRLTFAAGGSADQVRICDGNNVFFRGPALFDMDAGADTLQLGDGGIGEANFLCPATLHGGNGTDTLNDLNSDFDQVPVISSF